MLVIDSDTSRQKIFDFMEEDRKTRRLALKLCREYLNGAWKKIGEDEIQVRRISGGLTNHIFHVSLPSYITKSGEPAEVLLRLYGYLSQGGDSIHNETDAISKSTLSSLVVDNVIFTILSERKLGPTLYGVFSEGRLEEFINARPMRDEEIRDSELSGIIARKLAKIHKLSVPINREKPWLFDLYEKYMDEADKLKIEDVSEVSAQVSKQLFNFDFKGEIEWLSKFLARVHSPIVFCHNDVQGGNILLRELSSLGDDRLMFIDYEFCGYNYRAFDIANHLCEWVYNYHNKKFPFFHCQRENFPSKERQLEFLKAYLSEDEALSPAVRSRNSSGRSTTRQRRSTLSREQQVEMLFQEVQAFILAANLLWCLWGMANSTNDKIPFGYWEYASSRLSDYLNHKQRLLDQTDLTRAGDKRTSSSSSCDS